MKLALSTMWWDKQPASLKNLAWRTRAMGFSQVEMDYRFPAQALQELRPALLETGLEISSVHAPFPRPPGPDPLQQANLAADDPQMRQEALDRVAKTLEMAAQWGADTIVLHAGNIEALRPMETELKNLFRLDRTTGELYRQRQRELRAQRAQQAPRFFERVWKALKFLVPIAQSLDVCIALENRADFRDLPSLDEMTRLLQEFSPTVGYWHDLGHAFRLEKTAFYDQDVWLHHFSSHLRGVHLHDSIGLKDHQPPGQGEIDFDRLTPLLPNQTQRVFEVRSIHPESALAAGLAHLRSIGMLS
jgi:sugar phosphate isomerase/epimerase